MEVDSTQWVSRCVSQDGEKSGESDGTFKILIPYDHLITLDLEVVDPPTHLCRPYGDFSLGSSPVGGILPYLTRIGTDMHTGETMVNTIFIQQVLVLNLNQRIAFLVCDGE